MDLQARQNPPRHSPETFDLENQTQVSKGEMRVLGPREREARIRKEMKGHKNKMSLQLPTIR